MKLLLIHNNHITSSQKTKNGLSLSIKPDSTLLNQKRPFYIPDITDKFIIQPYPVIKINRLGKSISKKFAHRYYGEVTLGANIFSKNLKNKISETNSIDGLSDIYDNSSVVGDFFEKEKLNGDDKFHLFINKELKQSISFDELLLSPDELIEQISSVSTLKIGDLIFSGTDEDNETELQINDRVEGYYGNNLLYSFTVK